MKHKVAELEGALLDAAVAKAEGQWSAESVKAIAEHPGVWRPSTSWIFGGPIIERERMCIQCPDVIDADLGRGQWSANVYGAGAWQEGTTPLIAAMRAYVASKFGEEIDL